MLEGRATRSLYSTLGGLSYPQAAGLFQAGICGNGRILLTSVPEMLFNSGFRAHYIDGLCRSQHGIGMRQRPKSESMGGMTRFIFAD
jgi:hypothetical protein